jgi:hypothetical protein
MHESLKRPLFRKKAMEVYQAKQGGKVPGYVYGALIQGARAAGPFIARQFARPTVQKGLLGVEALGAGAGLEETRRGLSGEQSIFGEEPASVAGGLATLAYPGIGAFGRTLPKAFPGSVRAAGAGEAVTRKTPFALPTALLGIPVGMAESEIKGAIKEEKETRLEDPKKVQDLTNKLNALGPNATIGQVFNTIDTYDLTDKQKNAAYSQIGLTVEDIKSLRGSKQQVPQDQKTGVVGETTSDNAVQKNMMSVMDGGNPNNMSPDEQEKMALKVVDKTNKANKEIRNLEEKNKDNDDFKRQFSSLRNQIQSATGNGDMTNLILLKLASGLLTGKTTQRGVGGFLDVLGQATGPTVDTAILLANQQKEFDQSLALALIKSNSEKTGGLKAESKRVYVEELNPNDDLFPVVTRLVPQNKDTGALLDVVQTDQGEAFVPYTKGGKLKEPDARAKNLSDKSMRDLSVGLEFANIVTNAPPELLGPGATVRQFMDRFSGATQSYQSSIGNFDEFQTKTFNEISDAIMNEEQFKNLSGSSLEKAKEENNKILSQFQKESEKYTADLYKALDSGDQERVARAQLGLIEQRMKYIVANANKAQDRLTAADVKNAEARTKIFTYFDNPKQIKKNYESLATEMNSNFRKQARNYVANGGSKDYVLNMYQNVPVIQDYKIKQSKGEIKAKTKQDYKTVLGTI